MPPYCSALVFVVKENNVSASLLSVTLYQKNAEIETVSIPSSVTPAMWKKLVVETKDLSRVTPTMLQEVVETHNESGVTLTIFQVVL